MAEAKQVTVEEFLARRKANPKAVVIDVRDDAKWKEGHIPGAKHMHKSTIGKQIPAAEKNGKTGK